MSGMFHARGPRTRRLLQTLGRRGRVSVARRAAFDAANHEALFRSRAIVFTDTADFTARTARDGILQFLMLFDRAVVTLEPFIKGNGGQIVKVEGDSMMLRFPDASAACRGVIEMDAALRRSNRGKPASDQLQFSYGIGFGEMLDIEGDLFGLEVNLASKLGEDMAEPGEALLTPQAAAAVDATMRKRVVAHQVVMFGTHAIAVQRLKIRSGDPAVTRVRRP